MAGEVLYRPGQIQLDTDSATGHVRWSVRPFRFAWDTCYLWIVGPFGSIPLAEVHVRDHAVQFSLGFAAGRELPFMACEAIAIHEG